MSNSIQIAGASFSKVLTALTLPDRSDILCEYVFGTSAAQSVRNIANLSASGTETGSVASLNRVSNGSGGTDGTYALAFSGGGAGSGAAGTFTVTGGAISAVNLTNTGVLYSSDPAVSVAACPGLTGAVVTATRSVPTYASNSMVIATGVAALHAKSGIRTGIIPTSDVITMFIVRQRGSNAGSDAQIAGMYNGGQKFGFDEDGTTAYFKAGSSNNTHGAKLPLPAAGVWTFQAGVGVAAGGFAKGYYYGSVGAATTTEVVDTNPTVGALSEIYIGTGGLVGQGFTYPLAYFAAVNRAYTKAEIDAAGAQIRAYLAALRNITI
jgi:hypothetical protein